MSISNILRERFGTSEQMNKVQKDYQMTERGSKYLESLKNPKPFQMPTFEQVKAKFWELYCVEVFRNNQERKIDAHTANILKNVCLYLVDDKRCAYDVNLGLLLLGGVGTGKTAIMKTMQRTAAFFKLPKCFTLTSVPVIFKNIQTDKDFEINDYLKNNRCFDDVGFSEPTVLLYGQVVRPIDTILGVRYDRFINEGQLTHMTTNLSMEDFEKNFDNRTLDRLQEMCTIILFEGESFRGR